MKNQKGFTLVAGLLIFLIIAVVGFSGWSVWKNNKSDDSKNLEVSNVENKQLSSEEEIKSNDTITPASDIVSGYEFEYSPSESTDNSTEDPATSNDCPSTKLDCPDVHAVVLSVNEFYGNYLNAIENAPASERLLTSNNFIQSNSDKFDDYFMEFQYDDSSLTLLRMSQGLELPNKIYAGSATVNPENKDQVFVQMMLGDSDPMTLIVTANITTDGLGNLDSIHAVNIRNNRNPL